MPICSGQCGVMVACSARNREVEGSIPSTAILLFDYLMLHLDYILYAGSLYGEDYLPLSPVYFMFPRNINLSICVLYGRLNICGHLGGLNPGLMDVHNGKAMWVINK